MACRQCDDLIAQPEEVGIGTDDERASSLVNKRGKSGSQLASWFLNNPCRETRGRSGAW